MTQVKQMTQAEVQDKLVAKAQTEPEFRSRLLSDPKAAIGEAFGSEIPEAIDIQVHVDSATSFHLVLPPNGKLSEEELAAAFAGCTWVSQCELAWLDGSH